MLNKLTLVLLVIIIFVHSFVLTKLIYFPYPELFIYPYLTNHGLKPYSQIMDQHFPGLLFLPINLNNLGMTTPEIARMWSISIVVIIHLLLFLLSNHLFKSKIKAIFVNLLFLIWQPFFEGWVLWIDSFLPLFLLPATYLILKKRFFIAGLFLGIAIVFKQVMIPLGIFAMLYIFWENREFKSVGVYFLGLLIPLVIMILYLIDLGSFWDFWYWTVVFNITTYAQMGRGELPAISHLTRVGLVFGTSFIIIRKIKEAEGKLLLIFILGTLLGLSTRFDFVHFQPALPFAILATLYGFGKLGRFWKLGILGYMLIMVWWQVTFYKGHIGNKVFFFDAETKEIASKIRQYSKPADRIFVFGAPPHLYQMSERLPAGNLFVFQFPWFLKVSEERILTGLIHERPKIIAADRSIEIEGVKITEFAKKIDEYIQKNYQTIDSVGATQILSRRAN